MEIVGLVLLGYLAGLMTMQAVMARRERVLVRRIMAELAIVQATLSARWGEKSEDGGPV